MYVVSGIDNANVSIKKIYISSIASQTFISVPSVICCWLIKRYSLYSKRNNSFTPQKILPISLLLIYKSLSFALILLAISIDYANNTAPIKFAPKLPLKTHQLLSIFINDKIAKTIPTIAKTK